MGVIPVDGEIWVGDPAVGVLVLAVSTAGIIRIAATEQASITLDRETPDVLMVRLSMAQGQAGLQTTGLYVPYIQQLRSSYFIHKMELCKPLHKGGKGWIDRPRNLLYPFPLPCSGTLCAYGDQRNFRRTIKANRNTNGAEAAIGVEGERAHFV
jgi:hypothetical protein